MKILTDGGQITRDQGFCEEVKRASGQDIESCYQCQKCASGCPVTQHFEYAPNQVVRLVLFGMRDAALKSPTIWLCAGCETCGVRCPNGIRISEIMDALKEMAVKRGIVPGEPNTAVFHELFLKDVLSRGRVFETMLLAKYKLKTGQLFSDLDIGWKLFRKGKLPFLPKGISDTSSVKKISERGGWPR